MKKKLLSLALAMMLLCSSAMAEAYQATVTFSSSTTQLVELLTQTGMAEDVKLLAQGLEELLSKLRLELLIQHNGGQCGISLGDENLIDFAYFVDDQGLIQFMASLVPNHYLAYQYTEEEQARIADARQVMNDTDWQAVFAEAAAVAQSWWDKLPRQESRENYIGDAYKGGTRCVSYSFDDACVAQLVDMISAAMQQRGVDDGFLAEYLYQENLWSTVTAANQEAAQANRYRYTVKQIYGEADAFVGLSVIVQDGENQVMTVSLGGENDGWKLVLGWGQNETNYYLYADAVPGDQGWEWTILLYQDLQHLGFPTVEPVLEYVLWMAGGIADFDQTDGFHLEMDAIDPYATALQSYYVTVDGRESAGDASIEGALYLVADDNELPEKPLLGVTVKLEETAERTWSVEGKQRLDMEAADALGEEVETVMNEEVQQSVNVVMVQIFKELPTQLITFLMRNFMD